MNECTRPVWFLRQRVLVTCSVWAHMIFLRKMWFLIPGLVIIIARGVTFPSLLPTIQYYTRWSLTGRLPETIQAQNGGTYRSKQLKRKTSAINSIIMLLKRRQLSATNSSSFLLPPGCKWFPNGCCSLRSRFLSRSQGWCKSLVLSFLLGPTRLVTKLNKFSAMPSRLTRNLLSGMTTWCVSQLLLCI